MATGYGKVSSALVRRSIVYTYAKLTISWFLPLNIVYSKRKHSSVGNYGVCEEKLGENHFLGGLGRA